MAAITFGSRAVEVRDGKVHARKGGGGGKVGGKHFDHGVSVRICAFAEWEFRGNRRGPSEPESGTIAHIAKKGVPRGADADFVVLTSQGYVCVPLSGGGVAPPGGFRSDLPRILFKNARYTFELSWETMAGDAESPHHLVRDL